MLEHMCHSVHQLLIICVIASNISFVGSSRTIGIALFLQIAYIQLHEKTAQQQQHKNEGPQIVMMNKMTYYGEG